MNIAIGRQSSNQINESEETTKKHILPVHKENLSWRRFWLSAQAVW